MTARLAATTAGLNPRSGVIDGSAGVAARAPSQFGQSNFSLLRDDRIARDPRPALRAAPQHPQLRAARRPHGPGPAARARRTRSALRAAVRAAAARLRRAASAARRRWCSRSASAWATPPRTIAQALPDTDFIGVEVHTPGVGALLKRIGEQGLTQPAPVQHDAVEVLRAHDRARLAGRRARVLPRPLAQEEAQQAAPDPARLRARCWPSGSRRAATCTARPTGSPTREQMLEVLSAEPVLRNTADGYAPRPDYRPLTKFENRGLRLGHGVWDLVFVKAACEGSPMAVVRSGSPCAPAAPDCLAGSTPRYPQSAQSIHPATGQQHHQPEPDAVPGERHEVVRRDVAQQPAHAQPGAEEREERARSRTAAGRPPTAARAP